jgi:hypothetical protein
MTGQYECWEPVGEEITNDGGHTKGDICLKDVDFRNRGHWGLPYMGASLGSTMGTVLCFVPFIHLCEPWPLE